MLQLDDLQLEEPDASTARYGAISGVKGDLKSALEILECRLDLIEKVDNSKIGWPAAVGYEKMNGLVKKSDSDKIWAEAEKAISDQKRKERAQPFRDGPAQAGKDQYYSRSARGSSLYGFTVFSSYIFFLLCDLAPIPTCLHLCYDF